MFHISKSLIEHCKGNTFIRITQIFQYLFSYYLKDLTFDTPKRPATFDSDRPAIRVKTEKKPYPFTPSEVVTAPL